MPLTLLRHFLRQGRLHFEKFGCIDRVSDYPEGYVVLVDFDSDGEVIRIPQVNSIFRILGLSYSFILYHKTRRGWHVSIPLNEKLQRSELIALQVILGDDKMRGALNLMRVIQIRKSRGKLPKFWLQRHNILYQYKVEK